MIESTMRELMRTFNPGERLIEKDKLAEGEAILLRVLLDGLPDVLGSPFFASMHCYS